MPIVLLCPSCKVRLTLEDESGGTSFPCPRCDTAITVPIIIAPGDDARTGETDSRSSKLDSGEDTETSRPAGPRWYVIRGEKERGPFSAKQLKDMAAKGYIRPTDLVNVRPHSRRTARPASSIEGLFPEPTEEPELDLGDVRPAPVTLKPGGPRHSPTTAVTKVSCPKCHKSHKVLGVLSDHSLTCDFCDTRFVVTLESSTLSDAAGAAARRVRPDSEPIPLDDEFDYEPAHVRRRRRINRATTMWRAATIPALVISIICYFLPWVAYNILIPGLGLRERSIEFASQSGMEASFALVTLHPALEAAAKTEVARQEIKWLSEGKSPFKEWMKRSRPYLATWLALSPLCLLCACLWVLVSQPEVGSCLTVLTLSGVSGLIIAIQFGIFGPPALAAFYEQLGAVDGPTALVASLLIDVRYTTGFIVFALMHAYLFTVQACTIYLTRRTTD